MADRITSATDEAFEAALRAFIAAILTEFAAFSPATSGSVARNLRPRFFLMPDGATRTLPIAEDCFFLGAAIVYTTGQLTVAIDNTGQADQLAGSHRELTGMIGAAGPAESTLGKLRTFVRKNSVISFGVNSGPQLVCLLFETLGK